MRQDAEHLGHAKQRLATSEAGAEAGHVPKGMAASEASPKTGIGAAQADEGQVTLSSDDLEFYLAVEVHYHRARQAFLAASHRWAMFVTIISGASAAAPIAPAISGMIAAAVGASDIAFDFTGRSQAHADIARRYLALVTKLANGEDKNEVRNEWLSISADEPATYRLAQIIAHNNAIQSLGRDAPLEQLTFWQRIRANVWRS